MSEYLKAQFIQELLSKSPEKMTSLWVLERIPHVFNEERELFVDWKLALATKLQIDSGSILLVGSSCVGISLHPYKNYRAFNETSDIDVAIVSDYYFTESWRTLRNLGAQFHKLPPTWKSDIKKHVENYIYWGTIATDYILPLLPFGPQWQKALLEMSIIPPTNKRTIKVRIYRDFESLRSYHTKNIRELRDKALTQGDE